MSQISFPMSDISFLCCVMSMLVIVLHLYDTENTKVQTVEIYQTIRELLRRTRLLFDLLLELKLGECDQY